ncbi:VPA1262 family protein [Filibacter tadaridae]|uniref:Uncharacterized protein n=1 Tax=Filibacter tadaridae TaxID=2483811 RepID=A0A3P5XCB0_9BACL|nr:VPA1262 family protein [Filibacter tadaridae]VDC25144.1 hypothetical protein FILTAD_01186 [Filibacter tadaridae]
MYGLTIYILTNEKTNETYWLYGSAIQINNDYNMPFTLRDIKSKGQFKLQMIMAILDAEELGHLVSELDDHVKWNPQLTNRKGVSINLPSWSVRPYIIANEKKHEHKSAFALTNNTASAKVYFALDKERWIAAIFDNQEGFLKKGKVIEEKLFEESTLKLFSADSERFGNFEIFTSPLHQSLFYPIGLHVDVKRTKVQMQNRSRVETDARGITLWADGSLEDQLPLQLNVTLWNGRGRSEAIVQDRLLSITSVGELIHCDAEEPISAVEVKLWNADGKLLHYNKTGLIRQINISMGVHTGTKVISDPWSKKLPTNLRDRVEKQERITPQKINVGDFNRDPWVEEAENFAGFLKDMNPSPLNTDEDSLFFSGNPEAEVRFFEFIKSKLDASTTEEVLIADPFFDAKAASKILTRSTTNVPLTVLTSLTTKQPETGGSLLDSFKEFLETYKILLPSGLTVLNVQNSVATKQQFHDRFFLIKEKGRWEGWLLGNSYNSQAQRYPSLMVKFPNQLMEEVLSYLNELKTGLVNDRPEAMIQTLFSNTTVQKENIYEGFPIFPHWELLMEPFRSNPEEELVDILKGLIDKGYFESSNGHYSWSIIEEKQVTVRKLIYSYLEPIQDFDQAKHWLLALSNWSYYGLDLEPSEVLPNNLFWIQAMQKTVDNIQKNIKENIHDEDVRWHQIKDKFEKLVETHESYDEWWTIYQYSFEYTRLIYKYKFILDGLWETDLRIYFEMLDKKWILVPHFLTKLHQVMEAPGEANLSLLATRLFYYSFFDSHNRPMKDVLLTELKESTAVEQRSLFIALDHTYKEEQQSLFIQKHASLFQKPIDQGLVTFIMQTRQNTILAYLRQMGNSISDDLMIELKKGIVSKWVSNLLHGKHLSFHFETDQPITEEMAMYSFQAHGGQWESWYEKEILEKLDLQELRNPFLYYHNYSKWRNYMDRALWSFHFGFMSLLAGKEKLNGRTAQKISKLFKTYFAESLPLYTYDSGLLDEVVYGLGFYLSEFEYEQETDEILKVLENQYFDPTYSLILYGSHPSIFTKRRIQLIELLQSKELKLRLGDKMIGRLIWLSKVIDSMSKEITDVEIIQDIKSLARLIESLLKDTSINIDSIAFQLQLSTPVTDADYEKWANLFRTSIKEMKESFKMAGTVEIFNQITGVGLYLFGKTEAFQDWLHQRDELTNDSPWDFIHCGKSEEALDDLIRMIVGNFS